MDQCSWKNCNIKLIFCIETIIQRISQIIRWKILFTEQHWSKNGKFWLSITRNIFCIRLVKYLNKLFKELVESSSLKQSEIYLDSPSQCQHYLTGPALGSRSDQMTSGGPLHLSYSTVPQMVPKKVLHFSVIIFTDECYNTLGFKKILNYKNNNKCRHFQLKLSLCNSGNICFTVFLSNKWRAKCQCAK